MWLSQQWMRSWLAVWSVLHVKREATGWRTELDSLFLMNVALTPQQLPLPNEQQTSFLTEQCHGHRAHTPRVNPPKRLLESGFSTPYTLYCLICPITSSVNSITLRLSPIWVSCGRYPLVFSGRVRHPLDSKKLFVWSNSVASQLQFTGLFPQKSPIISDSFASHCSLWLQLWPLIAMRGHTVRPHEKLLGI